MYTRHYRSGPPAVLAVACLAMLPFPSSAQEFVFVDLQPQKVRIFNAGQNVDVAVSVSCSNGSAVLESLIYVTQDGNTSEFSSIPVVCDGELYEHIVTILAVGDFPFHPGKAVVSAYVALDDPNGTSAGDTQAIRIKKEKRAKGDDD